MRSTIKVLCLVVSLTQVVWPQTDRDAITNTVTDQSGAVALITPEASKSVTLVEFA